MLRLYSPQGSQLWLPFLLGLLLISQYRLPDRNVAQPPSAVALLEPKTGEMSSAAGKVDLLLSSSLS